MIQDDFVSCLYFLMASTVRQMDELAVESFSEAGFCPSCAFIMMLVIDSPGLNIREISDILHLAPSTTSRFLDKLEREGLIRKVTEGKMKRISPTPEGKEKEPVLKDCWGRLRDVFVEKVGESAYRKFTGHLFDFRNRL